MVKDKTCLLLRAVIHLLSRDNPREYLIIKAINLNESCIFLMSLHELIMRKGRHLLLSKKN